MKTQQSKSLQPNNDVIAAEMKLLGEMGFKKDEWIDTDFDDMDPFFKFKQIRFEKHVVGGLWFYVSYVLATENCFDYYCKETCCTFVTTGDDKDYEIVGGVKNIATLLELLAGESAQV